MISSLRIAGICSKYPIVASLRIVIVPVSGYSSFTIILKSVDLPLPFLPTIPTLSPVSISKLTFCITCLYPKFLQILCIPISIILFAPLFYIKIKINRA